MRSHHRAAIRLIVMGMQVKEAAEVIGMRREDLSRVYNSKDGKAYAARLERLADEYAAAMLALGVVPSDVIGRRHGKPTTARGNPGTVRRTIGDRLRARMQAGAPQDDQGTKGGEGGSRPRGG